MSEFYDTLETRAPEAREDALLGRLPELITRARQAPGWARQLAGVDAQTVTSRVALATLPVLRKSDLKDRQRLDPPFGGLALAAPGSLKRLLMSPGPIFEPQGQGTDFWGAARALFAAGFRSGDIVHNAFAYHLSPGGFIVESGAHALGCAVVPAGVGNTEQQVEAIAHFKPNGYTGTPDFLKILLDTAHRLGANVASLTRALVSGAALAPSLRAELKSRGLAVFEAYATAELGIVAYETAAGDGLVVNETVIVEIVRPGTGDLVAPGEVGEVVVTTFNPDYPMLRLATGDLSTVLAGASACGRTNMRIKGWMGRADQVTKVKGMFVHPSQVAEIAKRHRELGRVRLSVSREAEQDVMTLSAETDAAGHALEEAVAATLQTVTKLKGRVRLVRPGSLPNDGKVIADERASG
jgi:phenylacetate-CoA ligase